MAARAAREARPSTQRLPDQTRLAALGSSSKRIEIQADFTGKLVDILKEGLGNLVDADLAEESANLQAFQIKQQLGMQSLSIANAGPGTILQLFQSG